MNNLKVGFAKVNSTPALGTPIAGYFIPRFAKGILHDLEVSTMILSDGKETLAVVSIDICSLNNELIAEMKEKIIAETGLSKEKLFISATHSHTAPVMRYARYNTKNEEAIKKINEYTDFLLGRISDCINLALADVKPAKMGFCVGWAPERVAYIRRYKMKDGSTMTCPPVGDPNIDHPLGELDQRVNVLRFDREGGSTVVLMNYGLHADTVNGEMISPDWPGWMRRTLKDVLDVDCMFIPGAEGDVGSTHVFPAPGDMNDTEISFDNEMKSPGMARFVGRALAGTVLQVYDKVAYVDVEDIGIFHKTMKIPANVPDKKDLPLAHKYKELHEAGRDCDIPYTAMELTTVVAEAMRMCQLENGPEYYEMGLTGIRIGNTALIGIPGEPFTDIGVGIKEAEGWDAILPCALTNGAFGYFPMQSAYDEGGYEARSSRFKAGAAERIIADAKELLGEMKN